MNRKNYFLSKKQSQSIFKMLNILLNIQIQKKKNKTYLRRLVTCVTCQVMVFRLKFKGFLFCYVLS